MKPNGLTPRLHGFSRHVGFGVNCKAEITVNVCRGPGRLRASVTLLEMDNFKNVLK